MRSVFFVMGTVLFPLEMFPPYLFVGSGGVFSAAVLPRGRASEVILTLGVK